MALPIKSYTLYCGISVTLALIVVFFFYPLLAISFEAGLIAGLLIHSAHVSGHIEDGLLDRKV